MTIEWHTKNINIQDYYKIIRRTIMFNADNGKNKSGYDYWQKFKKEWTVHVIPTDKTNEFSRFYDHITDIEVSDGIAWGITGQKEMFLFVVDSRNPFITRSNAMPIGHELLHAIYQDEVGTFHVVRRYNSPEGKKGTRASAATVIVHDNWYGNKITFRFWISYMLGWLPITIPFIPIREAKQEYLI